MLFGANTAYKYAKALLIALLAFTGICANAAPIVALGVKAVARCGPYRYILREIYRVVDSLCMGQANSALFDKVCLFDKVDPIRSWCRLLSDRSAGGERYGDTLWILSSGTKLQARYLAHWCW